MADKTKDLAVYVADHDGGYLDLVRVQLENAGMRVKTFGKRRDLMEQLEADLASGSLPRVLLLSALLPDGSGLELSKKLKEHRKLRAIIIAIVSAVQRGHRFSVEARTRFLADHYLEQPLDYKAIPEIVSKIAEGASAESFEEEAKTKMDAGASEAKTETPTRGRRAGRKDKTPPNGSAKRTPAADGAIDDNIRRAAADAAARYSGTGGRAQPT
ncbi:response regulator, partial [bacterium]|nr:response regulator [bacterium]